MKKFLTVLLVIAIMFTFSFSSAFADTNYTASDYANTLTAEMNNQISYLANAKAQVVNGYAYNNEGFTKEDFSGAAADADAISGYSKAAIEAAADAVILKLTTAMQLAVSTAANAIPAAGTSTAPDLAVVKDAAIAATETVNPGVTVSASIVVAGMKTAVEAEVATIEKTQAPLTKAAVEAKLNAATADLAKYSTTGKNYPAADITNGPKKETLTAAEYVTYLIGKANDDMATAAAATGKTDAQKRAAYETAYATFKTDLAAVKTAEDEGISDSEANKTVAGKVNDYLQYGIGSAVYGALRLVDAEADGVYSNAADATSLSTLEAATYKFYEAATASTKAKLFGVEVANIERITKTEAAAINDAFYNAIVASADAVKKYAGTDTTVVEPLWNGTTGDQATFLKTLDKAMQLADVYADVVKLGDKYKAEYTYGVKVYDDAKVDAAVKEAEALVYADLAPAASLKTAEQYLNAAATKLNYSDLLADNYEYQKLMKAIEDAKAKFYSNVASKTPATKVLYGEDKTPEEDLVYLAATYAGSELTDWKDIADDAVAALDNAESYDDITAALDAAKVELAKLTLAKDATAVAEAQAKYKAALAKYKAEQFELVDKTKYTGTQYAEAIADGKTLIDDATTVAGVEAAYAEAQALVRGVKTDAELKAEKEAVIKAITALPLTANLTAADKDAVMAAYDAYKAYVETPGADDLDITNLSILKADIEKTIKFQSDDINDRIATAEKELAKLSENSDIDAPKIAAMRSDLQALVDEGAALNKTIKDIKKVDGLTALTATNAATTNLEAALDSEAKVWNAEFRAARVLAVAATKPNATTEQIKAALDAYEALTDRQEYKMDADYLALIQLVKANLSSTVKEFKITAGSTAKKGSITVKWTVKGDVTAADGYQIWKSTKRSSGFKKAFTTSKMTYKNTKGLTKGVRYYYKVRAYKVIDGKNVYSDWSNKAYRIAK